MTDAPTERVEAGIFVRLHRRKVVQWGLACAAGAWGLLQEAVLFDDVFRSTPRLQLRHQAV